MSNSTNLKKKKSTSAVHLPLTFLSYPLHLIVHKYVHPLTYNLITFYQISHFVYLHTTNITIIVQFTEVT